ncbi:MAG: Gfo/Idh/MocA family oxidoreductase [Deltaproteobacteria bacterium]|nr:MAG: Gfo/Idh/MocA family oxidoreductase [Deltaproteobacteria bacterium]
MEKISVAVVGTGYLGKFHAQKYCNMPGVELVGVVDVDHKKATSAARRYRTKAYKKYQEILDKVDAVSIVVPTQFHYQVAKDFLQQGVDVLLEKPITTTLRQAEELIKIAQKKDLIFQAGHLERFNAAVTAMRKLLTQPLFIESQRMSPFPERGIDVDVVLDLMIHDIDIILSIVNSKIKRVEAVGAPILTNKVDIANAWIRFENGCVASINASRVSQDKRRTLKIYQPDNYIFLDYHLPKLSVCRKYTKDGRGGDFSVRMEDIGLERNDPLEKELNSFIDSVISRRAPLVSGIEGKRALEVALRILKKL